MRGPGTGDTVRFAAPAGIDTDALGGHLGGTTVAETAPGEYEVASAPTPATVAAITAWLAERDLPLADLRAGRQRLEDVFLRLTSSGRRAGGQPKPVASDAAVAGEPAPSAEATTPDTDATTPGTAPAASAEATTPDIAASPGGPADSLGSPDGAP
jgi:ABC-2 type transport system ATP-binding protein